MAGSAFQHRNLKGEGETKKNYSDPQRKRVRAAGGGRRGRSGFRGGGSRGRHARPGKARGPERGGADAAAPRPAPRAQAPPAAQAPREAPQARRRRLQVRSRQRAAPFRRGGHRGPAREGASRSLQREMGRAERRSRRKKRKKIGSRRLPGQLSGCLPATLCPLHSDGRCGPRLPSPTPPSPREAATVASGAEDQQTAARAET